MTNPTGRGALLVLVVVALGAGTLACLPATGAVLDGRDFLSVGRMRDGADWPLVNGTQVRLSFTPGSLGVNAGCNHIGGSFRLDAGRLVFEGASMTEMGCDEARHAQDEWIVEFLSSRPTAQLVADDLTLTAGDTTLGLRDRRVVDPDRPLVGPTWVVVSLIGPGDDGGAVSSIPDGVVASLVFHDGGTVEVETGCNEGQGRWALDGSGLRVTELGLTKRGCADGGAQVEQTLVTVLGATPVRTTIEAGSMVLMGGGVGVQLEAR